MGVGDERGRVLSERQGAVLTEAQSGGSTDRRNVRGAELADVSSRGQCYVALPHNYACSPRLATAPQTFNQHSTDDSTSKL